jgi:hypothetical protein
VPHLLVRVCSSVPGGTAHAHTDCSNGYVADMDVGGAVPGEPLHPARRRADPLKSAVDADLFPNTVDFAQRETEEMGIRQRLRRFWVFFLVEGMDRGRSGGWRLRRGFLVFFWERG